MAVTLTEAESALDDAVSSLLVNPTVRSVGIGQHGTGYGFHVIRSTAVIVALAAGPPPPSMIQNVPVAFFDRRADISPH